MSKRKTNAIILGVTLTLVMVLLGGVIAAVVTETNPKDWFKQEIQYSEWDEDIVKEYDAFYFDTNEEWLEDLFSVMGTEDTYVELAVFGDASKAKNYSGLEEGYMLRAMKFTNSGTQMNLIMLFNLETEDMICLYSSHDYEPDEGVTFPVCKKGFNNLGKDGLIEWDGEAITGAIYLVENDDIEIEYNGISLKPIK